MPDVNLQCGISLPFVKDTKHCQVVDHTGFEKPETTEKKKKEDLRTVAMVSLS